jgi:hypothetical protein
VKARYLEGARTVAPIGVAAAAFGLSFGVLARAAGMGWAAPMVMSATTFAGSAQFAVASVPGNAESAAAAIAAAVMLNARYAPISISVASAFEGSTTERPLQSQLIVDESWAIVLRRRGGFDVRVLLGAGGLLFVGGHGEIDARLAGLGVGAVALALRGPLLAVVVAPAATAAIVRLVQPIPREMIPRSTRPRVNAGSATILTP